MRCAVLRGLTGYQAVHYVFRIFQSFRNVGPSYQMYKLNLETVPDQHHLMGTHHEHRDFIYSINVDPLHFLFLKSHTCLEDFFQRMFRTNILLTDVRHHTGFRG